MGEAGYHHAESAEVVWERKYRDLEKENARMKKKIAEMKNQLRQLGKYVEDLLDVHID